MQIHYGPAMKAVSLVEKFHDDRTMEHLQRLMTFSSACCDGSPDAEHLVEQTEIAIGELEADIRTIAYFLRAATNYTPRKG